MEEKVLNTLGQEIVSAGPEAKYDEAAKNLLSNKPFLAWILKYTTSEFAALEPNDIIPYIDNHPKVSSTFVAPGVTNRLIDRLTQESTIMNESVLRYDIRFFAKIPGTKDAEEFSLIIDVEMQNNPYPGYDIVSRGILYCGRMLSEQMGRNVSIDEKSGNYRYKHLQKVYSIWLCFNASQKAANTISEYKVQHNLLMGQYKDHARSDLLRVIIVRLPVEGKEKKSKNPASKLHQLLSMTFSTQIPVHEKLNRLEKDFGIQVTDKIRKEANSMCNLSASIAERGRTEGLYEGSNKKAREIAMRMIRAGKLSDTEISDYSGLDVSKIEELRKFVNRAKEL